MLSLLAIGTSSIPTLERACQSTNIQVRQDAVLMMAMQKVMPPPWFSWNWSKAPINGKPLFELGLAVPEQDVGEMVNLLAFRSSSSTCQRRSHWALQDGILLHEPGGTPG